MAKAKAPKTYPCHCNQCGYDWQSKKKHPKHCASCISNKWDKPLVGKKLRKGVPSRVRAKVSKVKNRPRHLKPKVETKAQTRKKRMDEEPIIGVLVKPKEPKVKAPRVPRVKNSALDKGDVENMPGAHGVFPKKSRVSRVKKEKGTPTPEQFDKKATEA